MLGWWSSIKDTLEINKDQGTLTREDLDYYHQLSTIADRDDKDEWDDDPSLKSHVTKKKKRRLKLFQLPPAITSLHCPCIVDT